MATRLQIGSKLVEQDAPLPRVLELKSLNFLDNWRVMASTSRNALFDQVAASGWHLFHSAGQLNTWAIGLDREHALQRSVRRLAAKVRAASFNCLEVTEIKTRRFLGIPYLYVAADMLHIQRGLVLDAAASRKQSRLADEWARR